MILVLELNRSPSVHPSQQVPRGIPGQIVRCCCRCRLVIVVVDECIHGESAPELPTSGKLCCNCNTETLSAKPWNNGWP